MPLIKDPKTISHIFALWAANNPEPTTELVYHNGFQLLIAVILSAQSTDIGVNKVTSTLFAHAPDAACLAQCSVEEVISHIRHLGLFRSKAKHILATSQQLLARYQGQVPNDRALLEALPGVGRKTANVILNTLYHQPTLAVDTHVFRVANRIGLASGRTPLSVERQLMRRIPKRYLLHAHHWLILHGRYVCVARKPKCAQCPVSRYCLYFKQSMSKNTG